MSLEYSVGCGLAAQPLFSTPGHPVSFGMLGVPSILQRNVLLTAGSCTLFLGQAITDPDDGSRKHS